MAGVTLNPAAVTLDLAIIERSVSNRFADLPVLPLLPTGRKIRADLDPEVASLSVKGRPELMKNLTAEDVRLFVDATDLPDSGPAKLPIQAVLPPGITLVRTEPAHASITLKE